MNALDKPKSALSAYIVLSYLKDSKIKAAAGILPMMARMHGVRRLSGLLCPDASSRPGGETSPSLHTYVYTSHAARPGCLACKPKMRHVKRRLNVKSTTRSFSHQAYLHGTTHHNHRYAAQTIHACPLE